MSKVLAFVRDWHPEAVSSEELATMRAELRGLGAELEIQSDAGAWWFGPDDQFERRDIIVHDFEIDGDDAIFVLDATGRVRFSHICEGALPTTLGAALTTAGQALLSLPASPPLMFNRREWALTSLCTGFAIALFGCKGKRHEDKSHAPPPTEPAKPPEYDVTLDVNGKQHTLRVEARVSLLDALRERLELTGTKKGCDQGQCGACTVHADGRRVLSCMMLAVVAQGQKITTIEGLATGDDLHPMQKAFIAQDGFQCGYCTPGQIMSAVALLAEGKAKTDDEVREHMSGNLCRCGAYPNIIAAIQLARKGA
jgi:xanthine dehydrogenase YagT iron-sulfur-binding subunit